MRVIRLALALVALAALFSSCGRTDGLPGLSCSQSSTWQTVDDFAPAGLTSVEGLGAATDSSGRIYVIGQDVDSSNNTHWIVRASSDRGANWKTADDYLLSTTQSTYPNGIATDFSGGVYAVGNPYDDSGVPHWTVRKSADGGTTWKTTDDVANGAASSAIYRPNVGLNVFGQLGSTTLSWASRKSTDGGSTWTNEDSFELSTNGALAVSATVDLSGNIYAVGHAIDSTNSTAHWNVRKSGDGGDTWSTVDDFQVSPTANTQANAIGTDPEGSLFVVGNGNDASNNTFWIVRKSVDGGATWLTIRKIQQNATAASASSIGFDHLGGIWVGGYAGDKSGNIQWLVETSADGGATWNSSDSFQYSGTAGAGQFGSAASFAFNPTGDLYVTGQVTLIDNSTRWITRKLGCE